MFSFQLEKEILKHHNVGMFFESYENPVFLRKQADAKERNIKTGKELQDKSKCSALENDSVDTSISADKDMPVEGNSVAVNDLTHEKMENTSMNSSENIEVVHSELCDSSERAGEPAHKRIKVDSAEVKDKKSSAVQHELDAQILEIGKHSCVNDQESILHTVESFDDGFSALNKDAAESYQTMHNVTDRTYDKSDIGANSGCTEKNIAQKHQPVDAIVGEYNEEKMYELTDLCCKDCKTVYIDPKEEDLVMYLHAYRYKVSNI